MPKPDCLRIFAASLATAGLAVAATSPIAATEITDQRGKTVELNTPAKRIVYIPPVMGTYLTVDRQSDHIVGTSAFAKRIIAQGLLNRIFPGTAKIPDVTRNGYFAPNQEALLATRPEVVFQTVQIGPEPYAQLEKLGLKVIGITGVHGEDDFITWTHLAGTVAGKAKMAESLTSRFEAERKRMDTMFEGLPDKMRPKVLHLMHVEPLRPAVGGSAYDQGIRHAGGRNVAGKMTQFGPVTFEQVLAWDPDVILISGWPEEKTVPADLFGDPKWAVLHAVKARRVYKVPLGGQRFEGVVEEPLYWQWLAELLHPKQTERRFRSQFQQTYRTVYDYPLSEDQIDRAIYADANRQSAGFDRLLRR
ncbi:MAG: ABC transporter substrate-binding protein [Methylohalobius sp. ZOD2]